MSNFTSPQLKRQIDRFSHFRTAHSRKSPYFTVGAFFPQNCPFTCWRSGPRSNLRFLEPVRVHNPSSITIGSAVFPQMTAVSLYFSMDRPHPPLKLPLPMLDVDPHLIRGSFGSPESSIQTPSRSAEPFLHDRLTVDRQAERQTTLLGW